MGKRNLNEDLAICNAATPGPWLAREWTALTDDRYFVTQAEDNGKEVATAWSGIRYPGMTKITDEEAGANARFIAEAREGWPYAIERAIKSEEEREFAIEVYNQQVKLTGELIVKNKQLAESNAYYIDERERIYDLLYEILSDDDCALSTRELIEGRTDVRA